jgi:hypothetical protein
MVDRAYVLGGRAIFSLVVPATFRAQVNQMNTATTPSPGKQPVSASARATWFLQECQEKYTYLVTLAGQSWHENSPSSWENKYFVHLLPSDNLRCQVYVGMLDSFTGFVRLTKASVFSENSYEVRLFRRVCHCLWNQQEHFISQAGFELQDQGRCPTCGKWVEYDESGEIG